MPTPEDKPLEEMTVREYFRAFLAAASDVFRRMGPAGPLALIASVMPGIAGIALLWNVHNASEWFKSRGDSGLYAYSGACALLAGFALLPTYSQAILGGYAFGITLGLPAALVGFLGASIIGYEVGRLASKDRADAIINEKPKWRAVRDAFMVSHQHRSFWKSLGLVILLRLPPNSPFALMNLLFAAVKVSRPAYILGTLIGLAPRTGIAVMLGAGIKDALTKEAIDSSLPRAWKFGGIAVSIVVLFVIGMIASRAAERATRSLESLQSGEKLSADDADVRR